MISPALLACSPSGGGPAPYHADAVHFDGSTFFDVAAMTVADSGKLTMSGFIKPDVSQPHPNLFYLADFDPAGNEFGLVIQTDGTMHVAFSNGASAFSFTSNPGVFPFDGTWQFVLVSLDTNRNAGLKRGAIYLGRTQVLVGLGDADPAFEIAFNGMEVGVPDSFGDYPEIAHEDASNIMIWTGVSIVVADQTIASADLDNFIDMALKPVDPATAIAAYGTPAIACIGNASAFGQPNLGNAGTLVKTGTLTNASTSPSD